MAYVMMVVTFVPIVLITAFIPYVTRRTESFGVSIPEDAYNSEEIKAMRKNYSWQTALFGAAVTAAGLITDLVFSLQSTVFPIAIFVFIVGSFLIYLVFHNRMKSLKAGGKWQETRSEVVAVDTGFRNQKITFSHWWFLIPFGISLVSTVLTLIFYQQIPARIPMHYNAGGHVDRWADKSYRTVLLMPLLQLFLTALFLFINTVILKSKQQIDVAQPEKSAHQNQVFRKRWSGFNLISGTVIVLLFSFIQLTYFISVSSKVMTVIPIVVVGGIIIATIVLAFTTGQGGSRVKTVKGKQGEAINRDDDRYWKLGKFYFNPDDPAVWVEKRFGIGWTVNFAHPLGWGTLLLIILLAIFLPMLTT